ncbi:MAG: SufS family cysteine desulfurase [Patescibacteria group bacterium]
MIKRSDFPILTKKIVGRPLVYFDNAATTQKPLSVIKATSEYYSKFNSNVHRGINPLAEEATKRYEESRDIIAAFISAHREEVIFTRGATESINLVARSWGEANLKKSDTLVLSVAEHHSNIVPWLQLQIKIGFKILYIPIKADGRLDFVAAKKIILQPGVKFLGLSYASNVLGIVNPIKKIVKLAQAHSIITLIDATQVLAHQLVNVRDLGCSFLVFSGHKMLGPTGTGVLYGKRELLAAMPPFLGGGDMISTVSLDSFTPNVLPYKFEAGTPNIAGVIGLAAACRYLSNLGWSEIRAKEKELKQYFLDKIKTLKFIKILGTAGPKLPIFSLIVEGIHPHDAADLLGQEGIILRAGQHCAEPLHNHLGYSASLRASLNFYNTKREIDFFIRKLIELKKKFY